MAVIVFSSRVSASESIAQALIANGFAKTDAREWGWKTHRLIDTDVESILDVPTNFTTDLLIVLSTHKSKIDEPIITVHPPGNWHAALLGGSPSTLNYAPAFFMKAFYLGVKKRLEHERSLFGLSLEADHHGPTCSIPICFVEIGSNEKYFTDKNAARIAAASIMDALEIQKHEWKPIFLLGGGHYPREGNLLMAGDEYAIGHMLAKFNFMHLNPEMFAQAIGKNKEGKATAVMIKANFSKTEQETIRSLAKACGVACVEI